MRAPVGPTNIAPFECCIGRGLAAIRAKADIVEQQYLWYFFKYLEPILSKRGQGSTFTAINRTEISKIRVPLSLLSEQRRIVEILDQADALRKKRAEADAKAARILPALFYKMFGDPATNSKGWPVISLKKLVERVERRNPSEKPDNKFKYVDIAGVDGMLGRIADYRKLIGAEAPSRARQVIKANDVLISTVRPYLRATALVPSELDNEICSTGFCVLRAQNGKGYGYLYAISRLQWFTDSLNSMARGASYPAVTDNDVLGLHIPCPGNWQERELLDIPVLDLLEMQRQRMTAVKKLERFFAVLLHRAFIGDLTARWRGAHMKELLAEIEVQALALECPPTKVNPPEIGSKRHAGHDMYDKAALAAYITDRCHTPDRPMGKVKLAKLFYLVQQKAEIELTETFMKRAAGPLDDEIHKFLSLAQKSKWLVLLRGEGDLKPVKPGTNVSKAIGQAEKAFRSCKGKG